MLPFTPEQRAAWLNTIDTRMSSAAMLVEDTAGRVLTIKNTYKSYWTLPGGVVDARESPLAAALRELQEETSLVLTPDEVQFAWVANRTSQEAVSYQFVFMAKQPIDTTQQTIVLDPVEVHEYAWVTREQVHSQDRNYGQAIVAWADNDGLGYREFEFRP